MIESNASVFLAQSDTTAGFLSKSKEAIARAKQRPKDKQILVESSSIAFIKANNNIPKALAKAIRRAKKSTFILPNNNAFRVIRDDLHLQFLSPFEALYSSSANLANKPFCYEYAYANADIIVLDKRGIYADTPSTIFKARHKLKRIR